MESPGLFGKRDISAITSEAVRPLLKWTYLWMIIGLVVTGVVAVSINVEEVFGNSPQLFLGAVIAELVLVIALSWAISRLSPTVAAIMFVVYAALNGFTLSLLLYAYTGESVALAFFITAGTFAAMSVIGFTTDIDLTHWRTYLMVGLFGLLIALIVNMFLRSSAFEILISFAGVAIFMGLTAYDTQKIKYMAASPEFQADGSAVAKYSIFAALQLYLDFVNLFIFLLRLFGRRR
ncbi:MAG: Bax inhibitor-1/YccA family protein [Anaerolineae bacterium]|nr:Bax inhibitor-1/YccA family protein [Anaerolineae bacterium]